MHKLIEVVPQFEEIMEKAFRFFWENPETGYREWKGHKYLAEAFRDLGYELTEAGNIPGFYTDVVTGRPGPLVLVMGELDALICRTHPECDPETGAVHCCGHAAQVAALLGLAAALKQPGALDGLCGTIRLMAVPAEELIEVEYREGLRQQGIISYYGGKVEFMRRGFMDGVDVAFMIHTSATVGAHGGGVNKGSNGCIAKTITYTGKSAHAGGSPHKGINALYAANQGLNAINALRETFQDNDHIRVHPIITEGGASVNAIPHKVTVESYVRGANMNAIRSANEKVNRACAAAAAAMGAKLQITDFPGYWPRRYTEDFIAVFSNTAPAAGIDFQYTPSGWSSGCSDMGDICSIMPALHPTVAGCEGAAHSTAYRIGDPETACVGSAKWQYLAIRQLLENGAETAKSIVANYQPEFADKDDYFAYVDALDMDKQAVTYEENGNVILDFHK